MDINCNFIFGSIEAIFFLNPFFFYVEMIRFLEENKHWKIIFVISLSSGWIFRSRAIISTMHSGAS